MNFLFYYVFLAWWREFEFANATKFSAETFSEISTLAHQGKIHLDSLTNKANVSRYGSCWKNAITELQVGCKFLSEGVQNDLALKFTDCFLQMSGYEPVKCSSPKNACLKNLSDRAFNAFTEFYTHTHSICYFLQSQIWQEEAEKTIDKLSSTSIHVAQQLQEAEKIQQSLMNHQKESLFIQNDLLKSSKGISSILQLSQEKIDTIMEDLQNSTLEQKQLLLGLFENLLTLKSWAINEMSWFSSTTYFVAATIISFIFTSISRTRSARSYVLLIFTLNFILERFLASTFLSTQLSLMFTTEILNTWVWILRRFCIFLSITITIYRAIKYNDYNALNYNLLLEIRNQNAQILKYFSIVNHRETHKIRNDMFTGNNNFTSARFDYNFANSYNKSKSQSNAVIPFNLPYENHCCSKSKNSCKFPKNLCDSNHINTDNIDFTDSNNSKTSVCGNTNERDSESTSTKIIPISSKKSISPCQVTSIYNLRSKNASHA